MKNYTITEQDLQKILNYLTSRPYGEVHALVQIVLASKPNPEAQPDKEPSKEA